MRKIEYRQVLFLLIVIYIIFFGYICYLKFNSFAYNDFDLAIDTQTLWSITHGSIYSSIHRIPFLGNHMRLILFLIAPIYAIFPSPLTLLFLQTVALGLGSWGVYLIVRHIINESIALLFAFIYLIYPALGYLNLYEFHPTALSTCFIIFMFYSYQKEKFKWFIVFLFLALSCQENIPLVLIFFAIYAAIQKRSKRWIFIPFIIGIIYFYLAIFILMPFFGKNTIQFFKLYSHLGNSFLEIIKNIILHPIAVFRFMFTAEKLLYLRALFGPLSFLSLLSPINLIPSIPLFMQHLLSLNRAETTIYYHYQAELIPFIFISAIYGFRRLLTFRIVKNNYKFFQIIILFFAVVYVCTLGPYPWLLMNISMYKKDQQDLQKDRLISLIPKGASVLATFEFQPKLSNRKELYSFHHVYNGYYTLSDRRYVVPESIDYILMDANDTLTFGSFHRIGNDKNIRALIENENYGVLEKIDNLILFKRNFDSNEKLYKILNVVPTKIRRKDWIFDIKNRIRLLSLKIDKINEGVAEISFVWKCIKESKTDFGVILFFANQENNLFYKQLHPICYRIYPTSTWKAGEIIQEDFSALLPSKDFINLFRIDIIELYSGKLILSKVLDNI
jgi:uncharacterized membrane protein